MRTASYSRSIEEQIDRCLAFVDQDHDDGVEHFFLQFAKLLTVDLLVGSIF